jgi:hypothetical protein
VRSRISSGPHADAVARGKAQELRDELRAAGDRRDKGFLRKKTALKKIVANMTMGNDSELDTGSPQSPTKKLTEAVSALFPDIVQCLAIQVLEIKKSKPVCVRRSILR